MASLLNLGESDWEVRTTIDKRSGNIFNTKTNKPQLQVSRLFMTSMAQASEIMSVEKDVEVKDTSQLKFLKASSEDLLQVFSIRQERSWTSLNISRELFEDFVDIFTAFSPLWDCMFTFGKKSTEHECEFPGFRSRGPSNTLGTSTIGLFSSFMGFLLSTERRSESAYVIRRAELNNRELAEGQSPWSIRQSAVYHRYGPAVDDLLRSDYTPSPKARSTILLVSPSKSFDRKIGRLLELAVSDEAAVAPCILHSLIVADSVKGWMGYVSWLEKQVKEQSIKITYADLDQAGRLSCDGFSFSVEDRQGLKVTEDSVTDLQIILATLNSIIRGIRKYCEKCCELSCKRSETITCSCSAAFEELDGYVTEVELCIERTKILKERVDSTAQLLSDLLRYEDQRALKELTEQSQEENQTMRCLTEKSTKDAEAVKVLTIIGLVYLPTTFVANFFSTEFVQTDESGKMSVNANTWLLAAIALPLTILTVATWWLCVRYRCSSAPGKPLKNCLETLGRGWSQLLRRRKMPREKATEDPEVPSFRPGAISVGTWSTGKTTLKDG